MSAGPLSAAELHELLGPQTSRWHDLGLTVQLGTPGDSDAADQVTVLHGDNIVGWTEWSPEFPDRRVFRVVIDGNRPAVPFPAGFLPPDPLRARQGEQQRWLTGGAR